MRQLSARERVLLAVGAVALVGFVYIFGLLLPVRDRAGKLAHTEALLCAKIEDAARIYQETAGIEADIAAVRAQTAELMFPAADVRVGVMREIDRLASELGLTVTSVRPEEAEPVAGSLKHPTTFRVESDFGRLMRLLYELEQPTHRLWVAGLEISPGRKGSDQLQARFYVAAYTPARRGGEADDAKA